MSNKPIHINKENIKIGYNYVSNKVNSVFGNRENIFFVLFILSLLSFTGYMDFSEFTKSKFITIWMVLILSYLAFYNHQNVEKFLLSNFTKVLFSISVGLFFLQPYFGINNTDLMLMWGAIFAFWYGYKKYELQKNREIISDFISKSDIEINKAVEIYRNTSEGRSHSNYLEFLYSYYILVEENYINNKNWEIIDKLISNQITEFTMYSEAIVESFLYDVHINNGISPEFNNYINGKIMDCKDIYETLYQKSEKEEHNCFKVRKDLITKIFNP